MRRCSSGSRASSSATTSRSTTRSGVGSVGGRLGQLPDRVGDPLVAGRGRAAGRRPCAGRCRAASRASSRAPGRSVSRPSQAATNVAWVTSSASARLRQQPRRRGGAPRRRTGRRPAAAPLVAGAERSAKSSSPTAGARARRGHLALASHGTSDAIASPWDFCYVFGAERRVDARSGIPLGRIRASGAGEPLAVTDIAIQHEEHPMRSTAPFAGSPRSARSPPSAFGGLGAVPRPRPTRPTSKVSVVHGIPASRSTSTSTARRPCTNFQPGNVAGPLTCRRAVRHRADQAGRRRSASADPQGRRRRGAGRREHQPGRAPDADGKPSSPRSSTTSARSPPARPG